MSQAASSSEAEWFADHFGGAAAQIIEFLEEDGVELTGARVADVGSGDGTIALGMAMRSGAAQVVGYDIRLTDQQELRALAGRQGLDDLPHNIFFQASTPEELPAASESTDIVYSWSVLEHAANPVALLSEVRRILRPEGILFLQVWPLFPSEHGGHLWTGPVREPFAHLRQAPHEIDALLAGGAGTYPGLDAQVEWRSLNRLTLDDLQRALLASRLLPTKLELLTSRVHLDRDLMRHRLSDLGIGGVKLLAVPTGVAPVAPS